MSRADFARAAFDTILVRARGNDVTFGGPGDDQTRPPHEADAWISKEDSWDYAEWVDRRVDKVAAAAAFVYENIVGHPNQETAEIAFAAWNGEWLPWEDSWKQYHAELRDSDWARVNSWDKIKEKHRQLLELREELDVIAQSVGLKVPKIASLPYELPERVGDGVMEGAKQLGSNLTTVAIIAAIVGGVYLLKK